MRVRLLGRNGKPAMTNPRIKSDRFHYIDVAKGLLILMVAYGHFWQHVEPLDAHAAFYLRQVNNTFLAFYMPAFFFITGYCSDFSKPLYANIIHSFRLIMLPAFVFSILVFIANHHFDKAKVITFLSSLVLYGGSYWFLTALFVARVLYGILSHYLKGNLLYAVSASSFFLGFLLSDIPHEYELWYFVHVLLLMPFIALGQFFRNKTIPFSKSGFFIFAYIGVLGITVLSAQRGILKSDFAYLVPIITQRLFNLNTTMLPSLVMLCMLGILMIMSISKHIDTNRILEYLGRNSLVIYCSHVIVMAYITHNLGGAILKHNLMPIGAMSIVCFVSIIIACCGIAYLFNLRYLKILIGKF